MSRGALAVRELTPDDWPVVSALFGHNGACGGCWCMYWRLPRGGSLWEEQKGAKNQRAFRRLVEAGEVHGVLAFDGEVPVGWCCIGPRGTFPRIERTRALATLPWDERTWSVTCFYVPARQRGRGVASALLAAAVKAARARGAKVLEGYPVVSSKGKGAEIPAAFAWTGVPEVFARAGFRDESEPGATRPVWRKRFR
jgi:predicted GNAT family acetyltransferase